MSIFPDLGGLQGRKSPRKARERGVRKCWQSSDRGCFQKEERAYAYPNNTEWGGGGRGNTYVFDFVF